MLENYFKRPRVLDRMKANVLYPQMQELINYFNDSGYSIYTIQSYMQKIEHFGNWLKTNHITVSSITKNTIISFINDHLPNCQCAPLHSCGLKEIRAALNLLLYTSSSIKIKQKHARKTPIEKEIQKFRYYW